MGQNGIQIGYTRGQKYKNEVNKIKKLNKY